MTETTPWIWWLKQSFENLEIAPWRSLLLSQSMAPMWKMRGYYMKERHEEKNLLVLQLSSWFSGSGSWKLMTKTINSVKTNMLCYYNWHLVLCFFFCNDDWNNILKIFTICSTNYSEMKKLGHWRPQQHHIQHRMGLTWFK